MPPAVEPDQQSRKLDLGAVSRTIPEPLPTEAHPPPASRTGLPTVSHVLGGHRTVGQPTTFQPGPQPDHVLGPTRRSRVASCAPTSPERSRSRQLWPTTQPLRSPCTG